ncbi:GNAT family N-acetyltransferase [Christensenellaceae bacterium OttesenSCG-928-K19]|nr:GNAT family N-acetyltransferase [Christensenellaceae bacterium OttesenSCG-928-K19]
MLTGQDVTVDNFEIKRAGNVHRKAIAGLIVQAFWEDFQSFEQTPERIERALVQGIDPVRFFLALCEEEIIGVAACSDMEGRAMTIHSPQTLVLQELLEDGTAFIEFVAVAKGSRRQGVATALVRTIVKQGGKQIYKLNVNEGNLPAIRCYEKLGFEPFKHIVEDAPGGGFRRKICMKRGAL